ncbi:penicillin acylase family protein [Bdellovibrio sp. SKB1291214]|uniref:penicillin acylase family protein n=1 Tax=Bdellovibrio sp. SKB1291214 TaxID=1732569 RepID=UPI0020CF1D0F|nr:penicillin acylase family protein [Bdellovibrio sp. SKB1291214]UYL07731.1 penicillin acylase family protein [Bdellovibrio sp. SKB1291214]
MRKLKISLVVFAAVLLVVVLGTYSFMRRSLAPLDGEISLTNLSKDVKVQRDTYGIPHIFAQNKSDAFKALGYVMASERLFQMEMARRQTQGLLAEVIGERAVKSDMLYRSLGLKKTSEKMLEKKRKDGTFDPEMWKMMESFCDGVNQYVATRPIPYDLAILGITKLAPFSPIDSYVMTGQIAYSFGIALRVDPTMTLLAKKLSPEMFQELRNDPLKTPYSVASQVDLSPLYKLADSSFAAVFDSSNSWLVGPSRSASGKSIFANDPHIGFNHPSVWFEAHIHTPEFEIYGHYLPLVPFAILGHTPHHAWGFTMSQTDDMDLYSEKIDRTKKTLIFNGKEQPYTVRNETIMVKKQAPVQMEVIQTPHGPLMDYVVDADLSLKWAYPKIDNDPLQALYTMGESKDMKTFENALKTGSAPGLNVMYADEKNIAWWMFGDVATKHNPNSDMILDGTSGKDEYKGLLSWEQKPHVVNPANGIIVTANTRPTDIESELRGDWQSADRQKTITEILETKKLWNAEEMRSLQVKNFNAANHVLMAKMLSHLKLTADEFIKHGPILDRLKKWNFISDRDSREASLYYSWINESLLLLLAPLEDQRAAYLTTPHAWMFFERVVQNENSPWWKLVKPDELFTHAFRNTMAKWSRPPQWGDIHTIEYVHPLGREKPLNYIFNLGPYPLGGAYNEITNNKARSLGGDFNVVAGASTRRVVDMANVTHSWGVNPIGISGHMLSPFYKDQVELFVTGFHRPQLMDSKEIEANKTHELVLKSAPIASQ